MHDVVVNRHDPSHKVNLEWTGDKDCRFLPGVRVTESNSYSREQFNRLVLAHPCVSSANYAREVQSGMIRLRVDQWETPHVRRAASAGRLYRGMFINTNLKEGMEIELEADLLGSCQE